MAESWCSVETFFFSFSLEIEIVMNEEGKVVTELSYETWLWICALLCDITHHLNYLNTKLQG